ncbi:GTP 3',8-cyclase MoaA [Oceanidesulfovibrio marinus]|uniref:GTP 3',8-cyclase n=1 Tax=Oceanidesulfovibrio marinus TaxID=370038 RepID=A0A6P1ZJE9_9BACT|nr:GTP 3',8-cyclase MoaA [Oceanidesulfovibrio marinus]TVM33716.1 GTP 3',8-cyclase MoaA [Oceanidesulfovibrio marinus]
MTTSHHPRALTDSHGRTVNYIRLSITDRCNLRCFYCRAGKDTPFMSHDEILRYEELLELIGIAEEMGVRKVRLTGGEPLVRRDFMDFFERAVTAYPNMDFRMTTNGVLLAPIAPRLKELGLRAVNISLDTLDPGRFKEITGLDAFGAVWEGIQACMDAGIQVKLNAVAMRGVNEADLPGFIELARNNPVHVRFIEFMPVGGGTTWETDRFWSSEDVLKEAGKYAELIPMPGPPRNSNFDEEAGNSRPSKPYTSGPARMYRIEGGQGALGVISALTNHFCDACNRLRISSDGRLRTCLFSDKEYKLRPALRHPKLGRESVKKIITQCGAIKPIGHEILKQLTRERRAVCDKRMSSIGG